MALRRASSASNSGSTLQLTVVYTWQRWSSVLSSRRSPLHSLTRLLATKRDMVGWKDPDVVANQTEIFVHFVHILGGLYLAEISLRFPFEWDVWRGKKPARWTMLVYILSRWLMLLDIAVFLAVLNVKKELNCSGAFKAVTALGNIAVGLASLLLMIRAVAINASKKKYMIPLAVVLGANWGTLLHAVSVADAVWDPQSSSCSPVGTSRFKPNVLTSFAADCVFMGVSFVSLLRKEGLSRLWRMLYREGLICMGVATVAYLVPSVFLLLNLNDIMNYMFQPFASIVMVTCSTRMYRELSEFLSPQVLPNPAISTLSTLEFYKPSSRVLRPGMDKSMAVRVQMETTTATDRSTFGTTDYTQSGDDSSSLHFARP